MKVSVIAGSHLGDFFNIMPVLSALHKRENTKLDFVAPSALKHKFPSLRDFLEYQPMFERVRFSDETPFHGFQIHGYRTLSNPPHPMGYPDATWRAVASIKMDHGIDVNPDNEFTFTTQQYNIIKSDRPLVGERSHHSLESRPTAMDFLRPTGHFESCDFLDYGNTIMMNAWLIKTCPVFITAFTGTSVLADLLGAKFVVLHDETVRRHTNMNDDAQLFNRHFYNDRRGQIMSLEEFSWDKIK